MGEDRTYDRDNEILQNLLTELGEMATTLKTQVRRLRGTEERAWFCERNNRSFREHDAIREVFNTRDQRSKRTDQPGNLAGINENLRRENETLKAGLVAARQITPNSRPPC